MSKTHAIGRLIERRPQAMPLLAAALLTGCATGGGPVSRVGGNAIGERVAEVALAMVGHPYQWGGNTPSGFDCSGLVQYAYARAGVDVPRTTRAQYEAIDRLYLYQLKPGDLVFFRTNGVFVSHVGIYIGNKRFVHALNPEADVRISTLEMDYWREHLIGAGSLGP